MKRIDWKMIGINACVTIGISTGIFMIAGKMTAKPAQNNTQATQESSITHIVSEVSPAVVSISVRNIGSENAAVIKGEREAANGTGFIVDPNGYVVTNYHVLGGTSREYYVIFSDRSEVKVDKVYPDEANDLAILKINRSGLPTLALGDSDKVKIGSTVLAIGNAFGMFSNTVSSGIVSGNKRSIEIPDEFAHSFKVKLYTDLIQTDASLNPGNSGGPLIGLDKKVIGINVASTWNSSTGFAIPVNNLKNILPAILKGESIKRAYLGITAYPGGNFIKTDKQDEYITIDGVAVSEIAKDSPAAKTPIAIDDIITHIDDTRLNSLNLLENALLKYKAGDTVKLTYYHRIDPNKEPMEKKEVTVVLSGK
jgi:S1-C subfamily serine protease